MAAFLVEFAIGQGRRQLLQMALVGQDFDRAVEPSVDGSVVRRDVLHTELADQRLRRQVSFDASVLERTPGEISATVAQTPAVATEMAPLFVVPVFPEVSQALVLFSADFQRAAEPGWW